MAGRAHSLGWPPTAWPERLVEGAREPALAEPASSWVRLWLDLCLCTIGGVGMWSVIVALPAVQADFGVARAAASLPYTLTMVGFGFGGILVGRLSDRFGIRRPVVGAVFCLALGYLLAGSSRTIWEFTLAQGLFIGALGSSATFGPLLADISCWFTRRRGIAVAVVASGNYLAGTLWPPVVQHFIATQGWRATYLGIGGFCLVTMLPLALALRPLPAPLGGAQAVTGALSVRAVRVRPGLLQGLLLVAGFACCVAMSMPQVHLVAYCSDLGYGPARGAQMMSLMLGLGIVSRLASGLVADRIGALRTLLLGSALQGVALLMFLSLRGLSSLYLVSGLFGLFQGGIVPSYALIVRENFPEREAGARIAAVITSTLLGMALGGWMSGAIFDITGSYAAAFVNGILWNLLNLAIVLWLLLRAGPVEASPQPPAVVPAAT